MVFITDGSSCRYSDTGSTNSLVFGHYSPPPWARSQTQYKKLPRFSLNITDFDCTIFAYSFACDNRFPFGTFFLRHRRADTVRFQHMHSFKLEGTPWRRDLRLSAASQYVLLSVPCIAGFLTRLLQITCYQRSMQVAVGTTSTLLTAPILLIRTATHLVLTTAISSSSAVLLPLVSSWTGSFGTCACGLMFDGARTKFAQSSKRNHATLVLDT